MILDEALAWLDNTDDYAWPVIKTYIELLQGELEQAKERERQLREEVENLNEYIYEPDKWTHKLKELESANVRLRQQLDGYNQLQDVFNNTLAGGACHDHTDCEACLKLNLENTLLREALTNCINVLKNNGIALGSVERAEAALTVPPALIENEKCEGCGGAGTVVTQSGMMSGVCLTCMGSGRKSVPPKE